MTTEMNTYWNWIVTGHRPLSRYCWPNTREFHTPVEDLPQVVSQHVKESNGGNRFLAGVVISSD